MLWLKVRRGCPGAGRRSGPLGTVGRGAGGAYAGLAATPGAAPIAAGAICRSSGRFARFFALVGPRPRPLFGKRWTSGASPTRASRRLRDYNGGFSAQTTPSTSAARLSETVERLPGRRRAAAVGAQRGRAVGQPEGLW